MVDHFQIIEEIEKILTLSNYTSYIFITHNGVKFATLFQRNYCMKLILPLIFIFSPLFFFAQSAKLKGFLSGKVTDKITGQVLPGATVYIHELKTGAITNDSGYYKTPQVNVGNYTIEISYQGYAADVESVTITLNSTTKEFKLS